MSAVSKRRRAPADLRHRTEDEAAACGREHLAQIAEDPIGVGDDVDGEEQVARASESRRPLTSRSTFAVRCRPNNPPTPFSVKPKPNWIGVNSALMTMMQREARLSARQTRLQHPESLERELILELQLQHPRVTRELRLEAQESAALEAAAIDRQPETGGRFEMR